jgi:glycosyltransferase involved in cell wall biosynthesis
MNKHRIDILVYKMYSSDTDCFIEDILNYSRNSIILVFDFDKITIKYMPLNTNFKNIPILFFKTKSHRLNYYLCPLIFIVNMIILLKLFISICWRYRPKICWIENCYVGLIVGILNKCRICDKSIYLPADWLVSRYNRFFSYIANNLFFPAIDYFACRFNDTVIDHTEEISEARSKFWGRKITKKERVYKYQPKIKIDNVGIDIIGRNICFIGQMREDSGLDLAIKALSKIKQRQDICLKIIGPKTHQYIYLKELSQQYNLGPYVNFLGFVSTDRFTDVLSDCFCGINVITSRYSHSRYTIPGKVMHYIQYLLPLIVTKNMGRFSAIVSDNGLGVVIDGSEEKFIDAVYKIYFEQRRYRDNIIKYVNSFPKVEIKELIDY